jgi:hypothetical protein
MMAKSFRAAADEGNNLQQRLKGLFEQQKRLNDLPAVNSAIQDIAKRGHLPDDDPLVEAAVQMGSDNVQSDHLPKLLEAAARQAETLKIPIEQVGTAMAKAYGEGSLTRLTRINILFSEQEKAAVEAAYAISEAAGRTALMDAVLASTDRNAVKLGAGLTEAQKAANDFARTTDDAMTSLGTGANKAQQDINGILTSLVSLGSGNKTILEGAGYVQQLGSYALAGAGIWVEYRNFRNLATIAEKAGTVATTTSTIATTTNTAAVVANGNAAVATAGKIGILARARMLAMSPLGKGGLIGAAGLALGGGIYAGLQATGALGKDAPGLGEAASNAVGRIGAFLTTGRSSSYDERIQKEYAEEQAIKAQEEKLKKAMDRQLSASASFSPAAITSIPGTGILPGGDVGQAQIDGLSDQIRTTKDKGKKAVLQIQLRNLQRAKRDSDKQNKQMEQDASTMAKASSAVAATEAGAKIDELKATLEEQKEIAQDALEQQIDAIRKQIKSKAIGKDAGNEKIDSLREAFDKRQQIMEENSRALIANIEAESILASAKTIAATQGATEAKATMDKANADAKRKLREADRATQRASRYMGQLREDSAQSSGGIMASAREAALAALRKAGSGRGRSDPLGTGAGQFNPYANIPKQMKATPIGQTPGGAQRYVVELVVPNQAAWEAQGI